MQNLSLLHFFNTAKLQQSVIIRNPRRFKTSESSKIRSIFQVKKNEMKQKVWKFQKNYVLTENSN